MYTGMKEDQMAQRSSDCEQTRQWAGHVKHAEHLAAQKVAQMERRKQRIAKRKAKANV